MEDLHCQHPPISWSELPPKLILAISKRLETKADVVSFRQVCKKWCESSVPNHFSIVLPRPIPFSETTTALPFRDSTQCLILQVSSIYLLSPSHRPDSKKRKRSPVQFKPWMVMVEESSPGVIHLRHPLTGEWVEEYPPYLKLTRFRVTKLAEGYTFKDSNKVKKVVMCSSSSSSIEALVLYLKGELGKLKLEKYDRVHSDDEGDEDKDKWESGKLKLKKNDDDSDDDDEGEEGEEEEEEGEEEEDKKTYYQWKKLEVRKARKFWFRYLDDVVSFKGNVCGVDRMGKLYLLDHETMTVASLLVADQLYRKEDQTARRKRLVVDPTFEKLHLVVRENVRNKARLKVYWFDDDVHKKDSRGGVN